MNQPPFAPLPYPRIKPWAQAVLFLWAVNLIFFYPIFFRQQVFFFGDTLTQRLPSMVFWKQEIETGRLPLWNPYIFAGLPHLADLSTNSLSPFNLIYLLFDNSLTALSILVVLLIYLASLFTYLILRQHQLSQSSSLFGAIVFAYSGTTLAAINDINSLQGIILIPIVFLTASRYSSKPTLGRLALLLLALSLQFISGHPQYSYYTWVFIATYLFFFLDTTFSRKIYQICLIFILLFNLTAVQLLPFLELSHYTYRPQQIQFSSQNSLQLFDLPRLLVANIYGNWRAGTSWGPHAPMEVGRANTEGYLGFFTLVLACYGYINQKNKFTLFLIITSSITLILAFGPTSLLYFTLYKVLPLFSKFRSPIRILSIFTFTVSLLAAIGLEHLHTSRQTTPLSSQQSQKHKLST